MKLKLFLMLLLSVALPTVAQKASVTGRVIDSATGNPVAGAIVRLGDKGTTVSTGISGDFSISNAPAGAVVIMIEAPGYSTASRAVELYNNQSIDAGTVKLYNEFAISGSEDFNVENQDMLLDEAVLEDEEGNSQALTALTGANDNVYYSEASYNFGPMYFRYRGYDSEYQKVYLNGVSFNDLVRGRFNFSTLMGLTSRAFRNKTTTLGLDAADYGFGNVGGSVNYNTQASSYAPGFNGSVAYTNSNYMLRALAQYSTGLTKNGWAFSVAGIGRYSNEGVVEGTFYNSGGLFLSLEKVLNPNHSLVLTAFGGPTQRANSSATYQEAYDLAGSNLYNPNWGWQDGEKRAARIVESFDPTFMLNWIYKDTKTTLNTAVTARWVNYSSSALNWYKALDPNPTYYRYLPSYFLDDDGNPTEQSEYYTRLWTQDDKFRQINWDNLYQINYLNNLENQNLPDDQKKGASYIQEKRHSNQFNALFNSYINHRLNDEMTLQAGVSFNYTRASFYKTVKDLMGGEFWLDIDPFSDREITLDPEMLQNDLDNPNRRVGNGDRFGYDYDINAIQAQGWIQNVINLPRWDINYGLQIGYTQFQRDGKMRNGRAPENSLGKGKIHRFDDAMVKAGAVYKIDGRNYISAHANYGTAAPIADNLYISPRVKDTAAGDPQSERILSADLTYGWNYRRFRGSISAFYTRMDDQTERFSFYDDRYSTFTNYVLEDVRKDYKGIELGAAYKILPSLTATAVGTYARYQYKNNPTGTSSAENGMKEDVTQKVYLKNYYVGCTPQYAANIGLDWAAPKNWYFNINATWQGDAYVNLSPVYHEAMPNLYQAWPGPSVAPDQEAWLADKLKEMTTQDKLKNSFSLNFSIGKSLYLKRNLALNFNLNVTNVLNNQDVVTWAYQQGRMDTENYDRGKYPNRYSYAQGTKVFFNVGVRF